MFKSFRSTLDDIWRSASAIKLQIDGNMELLRARGEALDGLYDDRVTPYILSLSSVARRVMGDLYTKLTMDHGPAPSAPDEDASDIQGSLPPPASNDHKRADPDHGQPDGCNANEERKRTRIMSESLEVGDVHGNPVVVPDEIHSKNETDEADVPQKSSDDKAPSSPSPNSAKGHARSSGKSATGDQHPEEVQAPVETMEKQSSLFAKAIQPPSAENGSIKTRSRPVRAPVPFNQVSETMQLGY